MAFTERNFDQDPAAANPGISPADKAAKSSIDTLVLYSILMDYKSSGNVVYLCKYYFPGTRSIGKKALVGRVGERPKEILRAVADEHGAGTSKWRSCRTPCLCLGRRKANAIQRARRRPGGRAVALGSFRLRLIEPSGQDYRLQAGSTRPEAELAMEGAVAGIDLGEVHLAVVRIGEVRTIYDGR
jgi:hypothetical protein